METGIYCTKKIREIPIKNQKKKKTNEDLSCDVMQLEIVWTKARVMKPSPR